MLSSLLSKFLAFSLAFGAAAAQATPGKITEVVVRAGSSLYFNPEFGLVYSGTGVLPGKLVLICTGETGTRSECGSIPVRLGMSSLGLSAFLLDYTRKNPLSLHLHVVPEEAMLSDVFGSYIGGRAGVGLGFGARTMLLVNAHSGVFATTAQQLFPFDGKDHDHAGFHVGLDLAVPRVTISPEPSARIPASQKISELVAPPAAQAKAQDGTHTL